jgi:hypothetical protein
MLIAVELKRNLNGMINMMNESAAEAGELHALIELKKTLDTLGNE